MVAPTKQAAMAATRIAVLLGVQSAASVDAIADIIDEETAVPDLLAALDKIAAWGDKSANEMLAKTGSYRWFDEPVSVEIARAALSKARPGG